MLRDLFFVMFDTGLTWTSFCLVFFLIGIILLIISSVKLKQKAKIIGIIVSIMLMWQIIPQIFFHIAYFSLLDVPATDVLKTFPYNYRYKENNDKFIKYMQIAKTTSVIPWQKGAYLCEIARQYILNYDGKNAIKNYDKAYRYIKSYKYACWKFAFLTYEAAGDTNTAVKIATEQKQYYTTASFLIELEEYESALNMINKAIENSPDNASYYALRAFINYILKNKEAESADYNKALSLAKNQKQKEDAIEYKQIRQKFIERQKTMCKKQNFE